MNYHPHLRYLGVWLMLGFAIFPPNVPGAEVAQLLYFFFIGFLYLPSHIIVRDRLSLSIPLIFIALTFLSLVFDISRVVERDLIELFKPMLVMVFLFIGLNIRSIDSFNQIVKPLFFLSAGFGVLEVVAADHVHQFRTLFVRDDGLYIGKPINFWHTTYFAASFYLFIAFSRLLSSTSRHSVGTALIVILAFLLIIFTQSRSGFLAGLLLIVSWSIIFASRYFFVYLICLFSITFLFFVYIDYQYVLDSLPYLVYGIENYILGFFSAVNEANSLGARVSQLDWVLEHNKMILFGSGIGKGYNEYLESLPALYYYRYGLIGLSLYFLLWAALPIQSLRGAKNIGLYLCFLFSLLVLSMSSVITDQFRMIPIAYLFLGGVIGSRRLNLINPVSSHYARL